MAKSKKPQVSRLMEETKFFDDILSHGNHLLVTQKMPGVITRSLPQTTCHFGFHCDHRGQPEPGTYRFSVERRERAMSATYPIESRGVQSLSIVLHSPTLMGQGKGGEIWMCVTCYEGLLDGRLYRIAHGDGIERPKLTRLIEWLHFIVPEIRSLPGSHDVLTLSSPQRHTVYLWVAVHHWVVYLCENPSVKQLLDDGVYVEKAFPRDLFPALNSGEALYLDVQSRDFRGYASNGKLAELAWNQVLEEKLSDSLRMSDELVHLLETEAEKTSSDESEEGRFDGEESDESLECSPDGEETQQSDEPQDGSLDGERSHQSDEGEDEEDLSDNNTDTKPPIAAEASSTDLMTPSASHEPATRGEKRGHIEDIEEEGRHGTARKSQKCLQDSSPSISLPSTSHEDTSNDIPTLGDSARNGDHAHRRNVESVVDRPEGKQEDTDSESEDRRRKRAKSAWEAYVMGTHCS